MAPWIAIVLSAFTFGSTFLGGTIALSTQGTLRHFFAFSSGTLLAIALVDLLPEAVQAAGPHAAPVYYMVLVSFIVFHLTERYVLVHHVHGGESSPGDHRHTVGGLGASGLVVHSFLDGISIGAAFQVNGSVGAVVALAVILHDFADGVNTVTLTRRVSASRRRALAFLAADAAAPVLGALATLLVRVSDRWLALALAFFVGHFLYIAASDLIPEMHRGERSWSVLAVHLAGVLAIVALTWVLAA
jgi:ZIP family zinc transporter